MLIRMEHLFIFIGAIGGVAMGAMVGSYFSDSGPSQVTTLAGAMTGALVGAGFVATYINRKN